MIKDELISYQDNKKEIKKTQEPGGGKYKPPWKEPIFVIQKHFATNLHYDFRLEIGDTLASWAVPKGLPEDRLQVFPRHPEADHDEHNHRPHALMGHTGGAPGEHLITPLQAKAQHIEHPCLNPAQ